jgi:hypothetical protein
MSCSGSLTRPGGPLAMPCVVRGGWRLPPNMEWGQVDHVVPRVKGGLDNLDNLVLSCSPCNSRKGSFDYEVFLQRMAS